MKVVFHTIAIAARIATVTNPLTNTNTAHTTRLGKRLSKLARRSCSNSSRSSLFCSSSTIGSPPSDRHAVAKKFVVFVVTALSVTQVSKVFYEFDGFDPLDHLES